MGNEGNKSKKVTIFTIFATNYGAILQAYALQLYLRRNYPELEVFLCNTVGRTKPDLFKKRYSQNSIKNLIIKLFVLFRYRSLYKSYKRKESFKEEEFRECTFEDRKGSCIYLTGSDQVFNPSIPHRHIYYQQFPADNAIKAAYAPSFGVNFLPEDYRAKVLPLLLDFDYLSCREKVGADFLSLMTGKEVPQVCDPTLLLDADMWRETAISNGYGDYIFIYDLNGGQDLVDYALELKAKTNLVIVCLTQKPQRFYKGVDYQIYDSGPREFVGLFEKSQFIVTDSFHGLMFAMIFNKPFTIIISSETTASRIYDVLNKVNAIDKVIPAHSHIKVIPSALNTDSRERLNCFIIESKHYLDSIVHAAK